MWIRPIALNVAFAAVIGLGVGTSAGGCSDELKLPGCVGRLIASCTPRGACVAAETVEESGYCFESGVRARSTKRDDPMACNLGVKVVVVANADGSPCYSVESWIDSGLACEGARYVWKDASGQVVATGERDWDSKVSITCAATSEATSCKGPSGLSNGDPCCGITGFGTPVCGYPERDSCTPGACAAAN